MKFIYFKILQCSPYHCWGDGSCAAHGICKRHAALAAMSIPALTATHRASSAFRVKTPLGCKQLKHRYRYLLDGWHIECLTRDKHPGVRGHGRCHCQRGHLGHHGSLVSRQLIDSCGNLGTDCCTFCCARAARCCHQSCCLHDGRDCVVIRLILIFFGKDVVHCLIGILVLARCAAKRHRREVATICLMRERLEGMVCLEGNGFPCIKFLEGEYV
jgi:hypothetical protein